MKNWDNFKELLDQKYDWPSEYVFKFIVPLEQEKEIVELFCDYSLEKKTSKTNKFVSLGLRKICQNSDEVISIYKMVSTIKGIISL